MTKKNDDIFTVAQNVVKMVMDTTEVNVDKVNALKKVLSGIDEKFIKSRFATNEVKNMLKRFSEGNLKKAQYHANKFSLKMKPYANDYPFEVNDEISVVRAEHGYYSNGMRAKVIERSKSSTGVWSYIAVVYNEENRQYDHDYKIEINHTRDAYLY